MAVLQVKEAVLATFKGDGILRNRRDFCVETHVPSPPSPLDFPHSQGCDLH
jgi:hypothetical protein